MPSTLNLPTTDASTRHRSPGAPQSPTPPAAPRPRVVFAVTGAVGLTLSLDLSMANICFPAIEHSFPGTATTVLSWVLNAYTLVFGALLVPAGRLADRYGHARLFRAGLIVFTAGSVAAGVAPSAGMLVAGRAVQGAGAALLLPASAGLLMHSVPPADRGRTMARWGSLGGLAMALGPTVGGLIVQTVGWRWTLLINVAIMGLCWLGGRRFRSTPRAGGPRPDIAGTVLLVTLAGCLALALTEGADLGWTSPAVLSLLAVATAGAPVLVRRCLKHPMPAVPLHLFRIRPIGLANLLTLGYAVTFFPALLLSVMYLIEGWHLAPAAAGLAISPAPILVATLAARAHALGVRLGPGRVLAAGNTLIAVAMLLFAIGATRRSIPLWLVAIVVWGLGVACSFPINSAAAVAGLPTGDLAVGSAVNQASRQFGGVLGVAVLASLLSANGHTAAGFRAGWVFCAVVAVSMAALSVISGSRLGAARAAGGRQVPSG